MDSIAKLFRQSYTYRIWQSLIQDWTSKQYSAWELVVKYYRMREAWWEKGNKKLVGTDQFGNQYYETTEPTEVGRNRWVQFKTRRGWIYDASEIPAEWHMWLHRIRDQPPSQAEITGQGRSSIPFHEPNMSGEALGRYYNPGHFFNPRHQNPDNVNQVRPFNPNTFDPATGKSVQEPAEKRETQEHL